MERKPILIVDDRESRVHPSYETFGQLVDFRRSYSWNEAKEDPARFADRYAAVCIHGNTDDWEAMDFIKNDFEGFSIRFRGEQGWVKGANYVEMHFDQFARHVIDFVEHYRATGEVEPEVFERKRPEKAQPSVVLDQVKEGIISFTSDPKEVSENCLYIHIDEGGHLQPWNTLKPLVDVNGKVTIRLQQHYPGRDSAGLTLLLLLRLGAFLGPVSRAPVVIALDQPAAELVANDPIHAVLFTEGVSRIEPGEEAPSEESPLPLTKHSYEYGHARLSVPPADFSGSDHDVANQWGALSLKFSVEALRTGTLPKLSEWLEDAGPLLNEPFYWKLLGQLALRMQHTEDRPRHAINRLRKRWGKWDERLAKPTYPLNAKGERETLRDLRLLFIDDQLGAGWRSAYASVIGEELAKVSLGFYPEEGPFVQEEALRRVREEQWDLVVCDLRLRPKEEQGWSSPQPEYLEALSGVRFLREVRREFPTLPIVVSTASSKAWTYRHLDALGADGYWVKEHPQHVQSLGDSLTHTVALAEEIEGALEHRKQISFLWRLKERLEALAQDEQALKRRFVGPSPFDDSTEVVKNCVLDIATKVRDAYQVLASRRTQIKALETSSPRELAFLILWGCINEVMYLRVIVNGKRDQESGFVLDNESKVVQFLAHGKIQKGIAKNGIDAGYLRKSKTGEPHTETMKLLLNFPGEGDKYIKQFQRLRKMRNSLRLIHGQTPQDVKMDDVKDMATILFYAMLLDQP